MEQNRKERDDSPDSFCSDKWTPQHQRTYSDVQKKRNQAIVRQLLKEFDLDETITRYRVKDSQEFTLDENDFSVDASHSTMQIRHNLQRLMGTDVIRLNDRNYTETLMLKLKEDYEANLDKKEKALEDAEKQRLRKLMLDGIITVRMMRDPDGKHRSKKKHKRKKNVYTKKKRGHPSIMHEDSPYYQDVERELSPHATGQTQRVVSQIELIDKREAEESQKENLKDSENEDDEGSLDGSSSHSPRNRNVKKQVQWSKTEGEMTSDDGSVVKPTKLNYPNRRYSKKEPPLLQEFRQEETVDGLYKLAERLVL